MGVFFGCFSFTLTKFFSFSSREIWLSRDEEALFSPYLRIAKWHGIQTLMREWRSLTEQRQRETERERENWRYRWSLRGVTKSHEQRCLGASSKHFRTSLSICDLNRPKVKAHNYYFSTTCVMSSRKPSFTFQAGRKSSFKHYWRWESGYFSGAA